MNPFANIDPQFAIFAAALMVCGSVGLFVLIPRTLYLVGRKLLSLGAIASGAGVVAFMGLIAALLCIALGPAPAILVLLIIGTTETILLGTPLAKYTLLTRLDPEVKKRIEKGCGPWRRDQ